MWDQVKTVDLNEPMYLGPLYSFNISEWDKRDVEQTKKKKSFKWISKRRKGTKEVIPGLSPRTKGEVVPSLQEVKLDVRSWGELTRTTTFHGVRFIFDKTPFKLRR